METGTVAIALEEAIEAISTGHAIYSVEYGEQICQAFGVPCPKALAKVYESDRNPMGIIMYHGPELGIWSLDLAEHIATCLGVKDRARMFLGRGSQAREYAGVLAQKLGVKREE